jgi:uncharacterized membrane protein
MADSDEKMSTRENDRIRTIHISREIPLWGILSFIGTMLVLSYSTYSGYVKTVEAVERLSISVDKLKDNQVENTIRYNQHDQAIGLHGLQIQKLDRDIEELKNRQRWIPK